MAAAEPDKVDIVTFGMPQWGGTSSLDYGLERTPFSDGEHRQAKVWYNPSVTSQLRWLLPASKLADFHAWMIKSTAWVKVPMETVLAAGTAKALPAIAWQQVRTISPIQLQNIGGGYYEVSFDVEHRKGVPVELLPVTP
jgi:hypothetical protein